MRALFRTLRFPVSVLSGNAIGGDSRLTILFAGPDSEKAYLIRRAFIDTPREQALGKSWLSGTPRLARRYDCDVEVLALPYGAWVASALSGYFAIPSWISACVDLTEEAFTEGNTRSRRRDLKQICKHGFHYEVTRGERDLEIFYFGMYRPTMVASHGPGALLMTFPHMLARVRRGESELVKICRDGDFVAGSLIAYDQGFPRLWSEGILHGDSGLLKQGVTASIYFLSFQYLMSQGYRRVNVGRSRAFLSDGALYYKRRLGLELDRSSTGRFFLKVRNPSPACLSFLRHNPFILSLAGNFHVALFKSSSELGVDCNWDELEKRHMIPGAARLHVYPLGDSAGDIGCASAARHATQVNLMKGGDLLPPRSSRG